MAEILGGMVRYRDVPAWYIIGWLDDSSGFQIRVKNEVLVEFERQVTLNCPIVQDFQNSRFLRLVPLSLDTSENWGFDGVFEKVAKDDIFTTYNIEFPKNSENSINIYKILVSLDILTRFLGCVEIPSGASTEFQLVKIILSAEQNSITIEMMKVLTDWLRKFEFKKGCEYQNFGEIEIVMRQAWLRIHPGQEDNPRVKYGILCKLRPGGLITLRLPGDICELSSGMCQDPKDGYDLLPHNIQYSSHVFVYLVGVAKLCSMWRQANLK